MSRITYSEFRKANDDLEGVMLISFIDGFVINKQVIELNEYVIAFDGGMLALPDEVYLLKESVLPDVNWEWCYEILNDSFIHSILIKVKGVKQV
ncbi:MAG: hypothetical protein Q4B63_08040 [Clostridium perfringens]|nr:hypothetical protein [Clostridium perfringens]